MEIKTWQEIYKDLKRVTDKKDFFFKREVVSYDEGNIVALKNNFEEFEQPITTHAFYQLLQKANMPRRYFERLRQERQHRLIRNNVTYNMTKKDPDKKLFIRTANIDGDKKVRAVLSDKYSAIENEELLEIIYENIEDEGSITSYYNDFKTMFLRIVFEKIDHKQAYVGDELACGILITNSEVGTCGIRIAPTVLRLVCNNGMTAWKTLGNKNNYYRKHIGLDKDELYDFAAVAINKAKKKATEQSKLLKKSKETKLEKGETVIENILKDKNITKSIVEKTKEIWNTEWDSKNNLYAVINSITRVARDLNIDDKIHVESVVGDYLNSCDLVA